MSCCAAAAAPRVTGQYCWRLSRGFFEVNFALTQRDIAREEITAVDLVAGEEEGPGAVNVVPLFVTHIPPVAFDFCHGVCSGFRDDLVGAEESFIAVESLIC